jgi:hypothetical protein
MQLDYWYMGDEWGADMGEFGLAENEETYFIEKMLGKLIEALSSVSDDVH